MSNRIRTAAWLTVTGLLLTGLYLALKRPIVEPDVSLRSAAHADHTPKHGGVFFMAPDGFHHLEGVRDGSEFRIYLYDNFTRPIDARRFEARIGNRRLQAEPNGAYLTLQLPDIATDHAEVTAFIRFANGREERFDFVFMSKKALRQ